MSKEVEPGATGRSGKRGNEVFWTHPTKPGIIKSPAQTVLNREKWKMITGALVKRFV